MRSPFCLFLLSSLLGIGLCSSVASASLLMDDVNGISFSALTLNAGQTYFVGLEDIRGLGINIVEPIGGNFANGQPVGTEFLDGWYAGTNFEVFFPLATGDPQVPNNPFAAPILRLYGTAVPEPSAAILVIASFALTSLVHRRTRCL